MCMRMSGGGVGLHVIPVGSTMPAGVGVVGVGVGVAVGRGVGLTVGVSEPQPPSATIAMTSEARANTDRVSSALPARSRVAGHSRRVRCRRAPANEAQALLPGCASSMAVLVALVPRPAGSSRTVTPGSSDSSRAGSRRPTQAWNTPWPLPITRYWLSGWLMQPGLAFSAAGLGGAAHVRLVLPGRSPAAGVGGLAHGHLVAGEHLGIAFVGREAGLRAAEASLVAVPVHVDDLGTRVEDPAIAVAVVVDLQPDAVERRRGRIALARPRAGSW